MATSPYEIIAGPANVWIAALGTAFPDVDDTPGAGWEAMGYTEGGVQVKHGQSIELLRVDQASGPVKAIRTEETLEVATSLAELTLENWGHALNRVTPANSHVAASLTTALAGANNDVIWTAVDAGVDGNDITIRYVDPAANGAALSVAVVGDAITVNLATDGGGAITSTADDIKTAVNADGTAGLMVQGADAAGNDGSGVVTAMAATNLTGGANAKRIFMRQGHDAAGFSLLVRGPSPYGDFDLQYEVPICVQTEEPEVEFVRDDKAVLAVKFDALEDPDASTEAERFGRLIAQTA